MEKIKFSIYSVLKKNVLFLIGIAIYCSFYCSYYLQTASWFYSPDFYHNNYKGLDYFAVPKAANTFFHQNRFNAQIIEWWNGQEIMSNPNFYHPLFVLVVGGPLQLFSPTTSFEIWIIFKALCWVLLGIYLFRKYRNNPHHQWALFFFFANFAMGVEIRIGQFQQILNILILLSLIFFYKNQNIRFIFTYGSALVVKPMLILWPLFLLIRKQIKLVVHLVMFLVIATIPFLYNDYILYYWENIKFRITTPTTLSVPDIFTLHALLYNMSFSLATISKLKYLFIFSIVGLAFYQRISLFTLFFLSLVSVYCFDSIICEYHYSAVIPFFVVGSLMIPAMQKFSARILMIWASMPSAYCFFLLTGQHLNEKMMPEQFAWRIMVIWKLLPLLLLGGYLVWQEIQSSRKKLNNNDLNIQ